VSGEYLHFRCVWHSVDGHFEMRSGFSIKCEVLGCKNSGHAYWYRGIKYATLPNPRTETNES